jgi:hypothetical protein
VVAGLLLKDATRILHSRSAKIGSSSSSSRVGWSGRYSGGGGSSTSDSSSGGQAAIGLGALLHASLRASEGDTARALHLWKTQVELVVMMSAVKVVCQGW